MRPVCNFAVAGPGLLLAFTLAAWAAHNAFSDRHALPCRTAAFSLGTAAPTTQQPQPRCEPPSMAGTPWSSHCQHLRQVCVDNDMLVFYEEQYQEVAGRPAAPLPAINVDRSKVYHFPWRSSNTSSDFELSKVAAATAAAGAPKPGGAEDQQQRRRRQNLPGQREQEQQQQQRRLAYEVQPAKQQRRRHEALRTRPATSREPAAYLAAPVFSNCTVPIVVYPIFASNFVHVFHDLASFLHALLRRTPWRRHAKLVTVTPEGLGMTGPEAQLLPPLTELAVQTWADFSARLPPDYDPAARGWDAQQPPPSFEGGEQRCFQHMFVCGRRFKAMRGLEEVLPEGEGPAVQQALAKAVPRENYAFGQILVQHMQQQQQQEVQQRAVQGPAGKDDTHGGSGKQASGRQASSGKHRLKIVFMKRGGEGRQLLNMKELLQRCNAWSLSLPGNRGNVTAECREVELPSLQAGMAAAQQADVFIGMHGANMANSWLMRPGSSAIEVSPFQFGLMPGSFGLSNANAQDPSSQVLWWLAVVCDPAISQPGPAEVAGTGKRPWWPRDRSARVPWTALATILEEVVAVGGDRSQYIETYYRNFTHRFNVGATGVLSRGAGPDGEHSGCPAPAAAST